MIRTTKIKSEFTFEEKFDTVSKDVVEKSGDDEGNSPARESDHYFLIIIIKSDVFEMVIPLCIFLRLNVTESGVCLIN